MKRITGISPKEKKLMNKVLLRLGILFVGPVLVFLITAFFDLPQPCEDRRDALILITIGCVPVIVTLMFKFRKEYTKKLKWTSSNNYTKFIYITYTYNSIFAFMAVASFTATGYAGFLASDLIDDLIAPVEGVVEYYEYNLPDEESVHVYMPEIEAVQPQRVTYQLLDLLFETDPNMEPSEIAQNIVYTLTQRFPVSGRRGPYCSDMLNVSEYARLVYDAHNVVFVYYKLQYEAAKRKHNNREISYEELQNERGYWARGLAEVIIPLAKRADNEFRVSENQRLLAIRYWELSDAFVGLRQFDESFDSLRSSYEFAIKALFTAVNENNMSQVVLVINQIITTYGRIQQLHNRTSEVDVLMFNQISLLINAFRYVQLEAERGF